ncbi:MAG: helix-turn-helix domain-containing protein [Henriciella sp.]
MDVRVIVGANFARIRKEKGLTQERVEELSGFSQQYISGLEKGQRNPTIVTVYELSVALDVHFLELLSPEPKSSG